MSNQKGFAQLLIIIAFFLLLIVSGVYYLNRLSSAKPSTGSSPAAYGTSPGLPKVLPKASPIGQPTIESSQQSNGWTLYNFPSFNVSIPPKWQMFRLQSNEKYSFSDANQSYGFWDPENSQVSFTIEKTIFHTDQDLLNNYPAWEPDNTPDKTLTLGKATATEYYECLGIEGCISTYVVLALYNGSIYDIEFETDASSLDKTPQSEISIYNQIISSLKFK